MTEIAPAEYNIITDLPRTADALRLIRDERHRQIEEEGYTPEHDDDYEPGTLADAAAAYAMSAAAVWPWRGHDGTPQGFKPEARKRDLVKAGALIIAELERIARHEKREREKDNV